jgi:peptidyl-prolyl cis-trans isomerase C
MKLTQLSLVTALLFASHLVNAQNIAVVNGKAIPKARVDALLAAVKSQGRPVTPELEKQAREAVITREIFAQEAERRGLAGSDSFKNRMEYVRTEVLANELMLNEQDKAVTDADVKAEYDKFVGTNAGKEYKARHILVDKEDQAKALIAQLKKGGKFEDLAKKNSKDPGSGANGGDLDWANPSNYVPEFAQALTKLNKGQMTDAPVKTQFGFHIIRLDDIREAQLPKFDDVKAQIKQQLTQQKMAKFQQELRDKAKVE